MFLFYFFKEKAHITTCLHYINLKEKYHLHLLRLSFQTLYRVNECFCWAKAKQKEVQLSHQIILMTAAKNSYLAYGQ